MENESEKIEAKENKTKLSLKNRRIIIIVLFILLVSLCAYVFFFPPKPNEYTFCFIRNTWGVKCCACGGTHCANYLMHFKFIEAFKENQFLVFALPVMGYMIIAGMVNGFFNKKIFPVVKNKYFYIAFFALFLIFGVVRNFI